MVKKILILISFFLSLFFISSSVPLQTGGSIKGMISPPNGAARVWAVSKEDTASCVVIKGEFIIGNLMPGNYTLIVEAIPPYKNQRKESVTVVQHRQTDVGFIVLKK